MVPLTLFLLLLVNVQSSGYLRGVEHFPVAAEDGAAEVPDRLNRGIN